MTMHSQKKKEDKEETQAFDTLIGKIRLKRISSSQSFPRVRMCCRKAVEDHCYRDTCIPNAVFTECGHYVTVKELRY